MRNCTIAVILLCSFASGIILHPDYEPPASWSGRPPSSVLGRWNSNASCVAVSSGCIITTRHQGGGYGSTVEIDGQDYKAVRIIEHPDSEADIRLVRLRYANFDEYAGINSSINERGSDVVLGGYGKYRDDDPNNQIDYGYEWTGDNSQIRWGTNELGWLDWKQENGQIDLLKLDFDGPGETDYECSIAEYDSGGGVFYNNGKQWLLFGVFYSVDTEYGSRAYYLNPATKLPEAQEIYAHRTRDFYSWAVQTLSDLSNCGSNPADIDEDCLINQADIKELSKNWLKNPPTGNAAESDVNSDGAVNMLDFAEIFQHWQEDYY
ncbi:hypothetical protein L21SP3_01795 [Sedimentisphaera cyanobacteriorum]|uniref:Dockerin domain-containing protein n=1 Tax=Sedimentisphaera cyanobacteriorum TaxID=1940790 RepID=A0A1Q2HRS5_9BACT|nr:dockerin type I domain-containing protein [Sedimentisphaera cyanobacteriorum]AQQ09974.1 hypothetical protein L21SP3_01795 [Sedimentisphaera cyanobacteriorum]